MKAVLCSNPLCDQRESLWRPWLQPVVRRGVFWDRQWYCSPECLQEAVLPIIQRFWEGSTQEPPDVKKSRLGVILVEKGIITQDQLDLALEKQVQEGGSTGEWLIRLGLISSRDLTATLSQQLGFPWIDEIKPDLSGNLLDRIPKRLYSAFRMLPVEFNETTGSLVIVTAANNPVALLHMLRKMLACPVHAFLASDESLQGILEECLQSHQDSTSELVLCPIGSPEQILEEVVSRAQSFDARELRIEWLGGALWCRYVRRQHWADLFIEVSGEELASTVGQELPSETVEI